MKTQQNILKCERNIRELQNMSLRTQNKAHIKAFYKEQKKQEFLMNFYIAQKKGGNK